MMKVVAAAVLATALLQTTANAFTVAPNGVSRQSSSSALFNIPPPAEDDVVGTKNAADRESPPQSFFELQINCARAAKLAIKDGYKLLEVEFPPLPAEVLEMDDVSAYNVAQANLELALDFAKNFANDDTKVAILFPDEAEASIGVEKIGGMTNPFPGVTISSLRKSEEGDERVFKPEQLFLNLFGGKSGVIKPMEGIDMYVCIVASAQELPDIEELHEQDPGKVIVFYNLKLDVLRGDLGTPAFPGRDFQDRFLSRVKPVYYLRTRQYSRSVPTPPFIVNYQGCLFRSYPGQFQTLLDTGTGSYRRVLGGDVRPPLGEFKEQLTEALRIEGVLQKESDTLDFLRTGYKTTTWWEEPRANASDDWRT